MAEAIPGIHHLKIPMGDDFVLASYVNVYLVEGDRGHMLIDTGLGTEKSLESLASQLTDIGVTLADISQIIITHTRPDHFGLSGRLKQLCRAKVIIHSAEKKLARLRYIDQSVFLNQESECLHAIGVPEHSAAEMNDMARQVTNSVSPAEPDVVLNGDGIISTGLFSFEVRVSAGHSPGHICLYEPAKKILFSGDHILPVTVPHIGLHPQSGDNPVATYIESLNALKQLNADIVLPGHEGPFDHLSARIDEIIRHHHQRNAEILSTLKTGAMSAYQLALDISWIPGTDGVGFADLNPLDQKLAIMETMAHLEYMHADGLVSKSTRDGIIYYQCR